MEQVKPNPANSSPQTPLSFLEKAATVFGDCPSIIYNDTTYNWSQTHRRCLQLACSLSSLGITRGDVVSIIAPNIPAMYEVHFAVPFTAAILNTINTRLDARTVSVLLQHCQSKLLFVDYLLRSLASKPSLSSHPTPNLAKKGDPGFKWIRPKSEWDPIVLNYTSGTTSAPKGVVHCHRGIYSMVVDTLIDWSVPKQPVYLWTLAMFHASGWCLPWGIAAAGGTNICLRKFDASIIYALIRKHGVTHMCGAPVVLNMLSNSPNNKPLKNPVHILTAGAPPPAPVLLRTELMGFMSVTAERARLKARQGVKVGASSEVDVVDPESGVSVKRDGSSLGEIVLRGGSVMVGYLKDPIGTRKCLTQEGWFYTGDVGVMHPDGYLEIKDRSKDVIISGGENLSSVEVESVLYTNPAINEAAVVARPDEYWGETPCAFVSFKAGLIRKPTEKEIIQYCRAKLPHYMVPKTVVFQEELPKTSTGKIQKFVLREVAKSMGSSRLSRL
ncbi:hypothetical protein LWI28_010609 [Acer negundo]|uniref:4-coumarate--CoA ligase n=1 Tax=Acer negundo TaxID=4023 RepID=A0AAD5NU97_ACENE|nr:hypothetical protein LWI28_010609 [Acer negundo]